MKKLVALSLATLMMCSNVFASEISVNLNGKAVEFSSQEPIIVEGRTLIPLRGVFEELGYEISWDAETKTATFNKENTVVKVTVNANELDVNGSKVNLDVPAQVISGSMMLPLRAVGEATGLEVTWDNESKTVELITDVNGSDNVITESSSEMTTEETTEKGEKTIASSGVSEDDLKLLQSAARCYITLYSINIMLDRYLENTDYSMYKIDGVFGYYYSTEDVVKVVDEAIAECEKYKNVAKTIEKGSIDGNIVDKFVGFIDFYIDGYEILKDTVATTKYDNLSEKQYKAMVDKSSNEMKGALVSLIAEMKLANDEAWDISKTEKYNVNDVDKLDSKSKALLDSYNKEIGQFVNSQTEFMKDYKYSVENPDAFISGANKIRTKLQETETPDICVLDREIMIMCCDLFEQAGKAVQNGAFKDNSTNEEYIKFDYSMVVFDMLFDIILGENYQMRFLDENVNDGEEILDKFESKLV